MVLGKALEFADGVKEAEKRVVTEDSAPFESVDEKSRVVVVVLPKGAVVPVEIE